MKRIISAVCFLMILFVLQTFETSGQIVPVTVQGSLKNGTAPANGAYDIRCTFYTVAAGGAPLAFVDFAAVPVANGIFSVTINSGDVIFTSPLSNIWIEFSVKPNGTPGLPTTLAPRQVVAFAPFAVSAYKSYLLGNLTAADVVQTNDARLTDARNPLAGSANYIQNGTTPQTNANFNIEGNGTVTTATDGSTRPCFDRRPPTGSCSARPPEF